MQILNLCRSLLTVSVLSSVFTVTRAEYVVDGLVAATFTAMHENGSINFGAIPEQAKHLAADGVKYPFVCGTTGESLSLTLLERQAIAEAWSKVVKANGLSLIVHVGAESLLDAVALAKHAEAIGADAIAAMPSVFFKASSVSNLVTRMAVVAAGAPSLPFFYYHIPSMTGTLATGSGIVDFMEEAGKRIPNFGGVKFTDYNLMNAGRMVRYRTPQGKKFQVLFGRDEEMDAALLMGIKGFVGSTYNYAGKLYNRIIDNYKKGNLTAVAIDQARSQDFILVFQRNGQDNANANKAIIGLMGKVDVGPPRLPQVGLDAAAKKKLDEGLKAIGFYDWA